MSDNEVPPELSAAIHSLNSQHGNDGHDDDDVVIATSSGFTELNSDLAPRDLPNTCDAARNNSRLVSMQNKETHHQDHDTPSAANSSTLCSSPFLSSNSASVRNGLADSKVLLRSKSQESPDSLRGDTAKRNSIKQTLHQFDKNEVIESVVVDLKDKSSDTEKSQNHHADLDRVAVFSPSASQSQSVPKNSKTKVPIPSFSPVDNSCYSPQSPIASRKRRKCNARVLVNNLDHSSTELKESHLEQTRKSELKRVGSIVGKVTIKTTSKYFQGTSAANDSVVENEGASCIHTTIEGAKAKYLKLAVSRQPLIIDLYSDDDDDGRCDTTIPTQKCPHGSMESDDDDSLPSPVFARTRRRLSGSQDASNVASSIKDQSNDDNTIAACDRKEEASIQSDCRLSFLNEIEGEVINLSQAYTAPETAIQFDKAICSDRGFETINKNYTTISHVSCGQTTEREISGDVADNLHTTCVEDCVANEHVASKEAISNKTEYIINMRKTLIDDRAKNTGHEQDSLKSQSNFNSLPCHKDLDIPRAKLFADSQKNLNQEHLPFMKVSKFNNLQSEMAAANNVRAKRKKGSSNSQCALCSTCPCTRGEASSKPKSKTPLQEMNTQIHGLARSDQEIERLLIDRLAHCEKSAAWHDHLCYKVSRELKKHRSKISKMRTMHRVGETNETRRFLDDTDSNNVGEWCMTGALPMSGKTVGKAQLKSFAFFKKRQSTLTQMFGNEDSCSETGDDANIDVIQIQGRGSSGNENGDYSCNPDDHGKESDDCGIGDRISVPETAVEIINNDDIVKVCKNSDSSYDFIVENIKGNVDDDDDDKNEKCIELEADPLSDMHKASERGLERVTHGDLRRLLNHGLWDASRFRNKFIVTDRAFESSCDLPKGAECFPEAKDDTFSTYSDYVEEGGERQKSSAHKAIFDSMKGGLDELVSLFVDDPNEPDELEIQREEATKEENFVTSNIQSEFLSASSQLTQRGESIANKIENTVFDDDRRQRAIASMCPNWRENIRFALRKTDKGEIKEALFNVRNSKRKVKSASVHVMDALVKQALVLDLYESALTESLKRHDPSNHGVHNFDIIEDETATVGSDIVENQVICIDDMEDDAESDNVIAELDFNKSMAAASKFLQGPYFTQVDGTEHVADSNKENRIAPNFVSKNNIKVSSVFSNTKGVDSLETFDLDKADVTNVESEFDANKIVETNHSEGSAKGADNSTYELTVDKTEVTTSVFLQRQCATLADCIDHVTNSNKENSSLTTASNSVSKSDTESDTVVPFNPVGFLDNLDAHDNEYLSAKMNEYGFKRTSRKAMIMQLYKIREELQKPLSQPPSKMDEETGTAVRGSPSEKSSSMDPDLVQRCVRAMKDDHSLRLLLLEHRTIELSQAQNAMTKAGVKISKKALSSFLDGQGIRYARTKSRRKATKASQQ